MVAMRAEMTVEMMDEELVVTTVAKTVVVKAASMDRNSAAVKADL